MKFDKKNVKITFSAVVCLFVFNKAVQIVEETSNICLTVVSWEIFVHFCTRHGLASPSSFNK